MGQQQLLLLVLGIVIVGLAMVVAIDRFSEKQTEADYDAITSEAMRIAGNILSWKMAPSSLGGGNGAEYLTGLTFDAMGYQSTNSQKTRANSSRYMRAISRLDTARPYIVVRPQNNRDLRVELFMYGPDQACFKLRRAMRTESGWVEADIDVDPDDIPVGCHGW